jgi:hypothetical protein
MRRRGGERELATKTAIELGDAGLRWTVAPAGGGEAEPVNSDSPATRRFVREVVSAMERVTRRATVRPAPKPERQARSWVPCPVCEGEAWAACDGCGGAGYVERHGD